jgi:eukaryotic-like serine/threonine-protein kinase
VRIGCGISKGLAAIHRKGIIHRDIEPENIFLAKTGFWRAPEVKILDFGLCRALEQGETQVVAGVVVGTPPYMAPEQVSGRSVDQRADLFGQGCLLYQMATGEVPYKWTDAATMESLIAEQRPRSPANFRADLPRALSDLIMSLLARSPDNRPNSAIEVARALSAF